MAGRPISNAAEGSGTGVSGVVGHLDRGAAIADQTAVIVYTWQPELVRQRLALEKHVQVEAGPQSLARRFRLRI
jgi:regulator of extracellular matrix RemA (YlzA/DUF370 family)